MTTTLIALGSNVDPEDNLKAAATMLRDRYPAIRFSSVYRSAPLHHTDQPDFLNAVAAFDAGHSPQDVLAFLQHIEHHLKKNPPFRFGPRTIDLDLLLHGDLVQQEPPPILPHPRMHERRFVLDPLLELLSPTERHPVLKKTWSDLQKQTAGQKILRMPMQL